LEVAEGNVGRAEWGIVYLDEVDKLARSPELATNTRDISGEGVQQALLRLVEGAQIKISLKGKRRDGAAEEVLIDTRNILFIAGGAFPGLEKHVAKRLAPSKSGIGFHAEPVEAEQKTKPEELYSRPPQTEHPCPLSLWERVGVRADQKFSLWRSQVY
jgi:ATP-dependent Clp protease ATP-binding subunit ClpX